MLKFAEVAVCVAFSGTPAFAVVVSAVADCASAKPKVERTIKFETIEVQVSVDALFCKDDDV